MEVVEGDERRRKGGQRDKCRRKTRTFTYGGGGGETKNIKSGQFKMPNIST